MPGPITNIATANATSVTVRGRDLVNELIGKHSFTEVFYFLVTGRMPDAAQTRVLDACLVTLMEHGFTPSALIARLTAESVPDQIQVSIGAGLLAIGSVHAGTMEGCAALLAAGVDEADADGWCRRVVAEHRQRKEAVPGLRACAAQAGRSAHAAAAAYRARERPGRASTCSSCSSFPPVIDETAGRHVTINATGALAALLLEIGIPPEIVRAIAVVSRCAGLVGHILEEQQTDSARHLVKLARETIPYRDPTG